jgi:hypothetical protein
MPSVEEINSWSDGQIVAEIRKLLPPHWSFTERPGSRQEWPAATIASPDATVWEGTEADRRILLLNAFGWIWLRGQKTKHPIWRVRGQEGARPAPRPPPSIPDPPDLDPEEINRMVYGKKPTR